MILAAVDIETTGLECGINEIVQLGIVLYNNDYTITNRLNIFIRPMHVEYIDEEALKINKLDINFLLKQSTPIQAKNVLFNWCDSVAKDKIFPLGQNFEFDKRFLLLFLGQDKYHEIFHYKYRDVCIIAQFLIDKGKLKIEDNKLPTLSEYFKIPHEEHDAISDCITVIRIYEKLIKL